MTSAGRSIFAGLEDRVHVGPVEECLHFARRAGFDLLSSIDTEEVLPGFAAHAGRPRLVVECHSAYLANIEYLRGLAACRPAAVFTPSEAQRRLVRERVGEGVEVRVVPNPLPPGVRGRAAAVPGAAAAARGGLDRPAGRSQELAGLPGDRRAAGAAAEPSSKPGSSASRSRPDGAGQLWSGARGRRARPAALVRRPRPTGASRAILDAVRDSGGVVVSTSRGESFGLTIAEAMARRCAVAGAGQAPFTEFVEDGETGSLFTPGSAGIGRGPHRGAARRRGSAAPARGEGARGGAGTLRPRSRRWRRWRRSCGVWTNLLRSSLRPALGALRPRKAAFSPARGASAYGTALSAPRRGECADPRAGPGQGRGERALRWGQCTDGRAHCDHGRADTSLAWAHSGESNSRMTVPRRIYQGASSTSMIRGNWFGNSAE